MTDAELTALESEAAWVARYSDDNGSATVLCASVPALVAEVRRLRALVKQAEWASGGAYEWETCPWCNADRPRGGKGGHYDDCPAFPREPLALPGPLAGGEPATGRA